VTDPPALAYANGADAVLVIGVGNDLRGDDGAGRAVVEELARLAVPGLHPIWSHQLVPELAEQIAVARMVVFVDAAVPPDRSPNETGPNATGPNATRPIGVRRVAASAPAVGGHQGGPEALLGLTALVGMNVPEAYVVSLPADDLRLGTQLSAPVRAAVAAAVAAVLRLAATSPTRRPADPPTRLTARPSIRPLSAPRVHDGPVTNLSSFSWWLTR
jgi:hydrogenase maturation protease